MTDLKVFKSTEFGELGVMTVNGKEYYPATQCAKLLGHKNPQEAVCRAFQKIRTVQKSDQKYCCRCDNRKAKSAIGKSNVF